MSAPDSRYPRPTPSVFFWSTDGSPPLDVDSWLSIVDKTHAIWCQCADWRQHVPGWPDSGDTEEPAVHGDDTGAPAAGAADEEELDAAIAAAIEAGVFDDTDGRYGFLLRCNPELSKNV